MSSSNEIYCFPQSFRNSSQCVKADTMSATFYSTNVKTL